MHQKRNHHQFTSRFITNAFSTFFHISNLLDFLWGNLRSTSEHFSLHLIVTATAKRQLKSNSLIIKLASNELKISVRFGLPSLNLIYRWSRINYESWAEEFHLLARTNRIAWRENFLIVVAVVERFFGVSMESKAVMQVLSFPASWWNYGASHKNFRSKDSELRQCCLLRCSNLINKIAIRESLKLFSSHSSSSQQPLWL